jgi:hypothetical protein
MSKTYKFVNEGVVDKLLNSIQIAILNKMINLIRILSTRLINKQMILPMKITINCIK